MPNPRLADPTVLYSLVRHVRHRAGADEAIPRGAAGRVAMVTGDALFAVFAHRVVFTALSTMPKVTTCSERYLMVFINLE